MVVGRCRDYAQFEQVPLIKSLNRNAINKLSIHVYTQNNTILNSPLNRLEDIQYTSQLWNVSRIRVYIDTQLIFLGI